MREFPVLRPYPRAVLFDFDDTLVDTFPIITRAMNAAFEACGREERWTPAQARATIDRAAGDYFGDLFGEHKDIALDVYTATYGKVHLDALAPQPFATETLELLAKYNIPMGVVTNKREQFLLSEIKALGWQKFFSKAAVIPASAKAEENKPHAAPVLRALKALELESGADVYVVGDKENDLISADRAGCSSIYLSAENALGPGSEAKKPVATVTGCKQLYDLFNFTLVNSRKNIKLREIN